MPNGLPALNKHNHIVSQLRLLLDADNELRQLAEQSLQMAACANPHLSTNPVRSLEEWFTYMDRFLHCMPWQAMDIGEDASFFNRIDQNIGYFYFLIDQPLDALANRGYIYPSLQYEPRIAAWLREYNTAWGEWLNGPDSWNDTYYMLAREDTRFDLNTDRYESPDNWHCWNDFFARRQSVNTPPPTVADGLTFPWLNVNDNALDIKTARIENVTDLLGDSHCKTLFQNGFFTHITLDIHNYHRFHSPVCGTIIDIRDIDGMLSAGGNIIWDEEKQKYRYKQSDNIGFQMIEKRMAIVIETKEHYVKKQKPDALKGKYTNADADMRAYIAIIPVGVAQVGSIVLADGIAVGNEVHQGQELGRFLFGGSDIVILTN